MSFPSLSSNLSRVRERVQRLQAAAGLDQAIRIVAVTKGHPMGAVAAAIAAGLTDVGENRVQEAVAKQDSLGSVDVTWHLIGHLQTNKANAVPGRFGWVHSVDSMRVAQALQKSAAKASATVHVLLQVNVAGEEQKHGCHPDEASDLAGAIAAMPALTLTGMMTMAPFTDETAVQRRAFARLRELRDRIEGSGIAVPELSMGMSNDYEAAVTEGATILRLGTALFGERPT